METASNNQITEEEKDILQEVMNISFGKASADLTDVINAYVVLSVPDVTLLKAEKLPDYIRDDIKDYNSISIIEQNFWGKFKGICFLIFPSRSGRKLVAMLGEGDDSFEQSDTMAVLEKETLIEVGNILIGACVGKVAELLSEVVTYSPPRVIFEDSPKKNISKDIFEPESMAIIMKTIFSFEGQDINGFLFLVTSQESFGWLKVALHRFMERYE